MGVHLFRGESTGPRTGGPGVHQSGGSTVPPYLRDYERS